MTWRLVMICLSLPTLFCDSSSFLSAACIHALARCPPYRLQHACCTPDPNASDHHHGQMQQLVSPSCRRSSEAGLMSSVMRPFTHSSHIRRVEHRVIECSLQAPLMPPKGISIAGTFDLYPFDLYQREHY